MRPGEHILAIVALTATAHAGPPYVTDDPEPVPYEHWEVYVATQHALTSDELAGTAPHLEVNYGAYPNVQLHMIAPLAYARPSGAARAYGPGDVELGIKLRFVQERGWRPMIGVFPLLELPTGNEQNDLGGGHLRVFLPLWLQTSSGPWTTYGGGGYWINPGAGNRNYALLGWQAQRRLSSLATLGGELYFTTKDQADGANNLVFDVGLVVDVTEHHHVMASVGRSIVGDTRLQGYLAYQLTL